MLRCVLLEHSSLIHLEKLWVESVIWVHHIHLLLLLRLKIVAIKIWIVCSWVVVVVLILVALSSKVAVGISENLFLRVEVLEIPEDVWFSRGILIDLQHFLACSIEFQFGAVLAAGDIIALGIFEPFECLLCDVLNEHPVDLEMALELVRLPPVGEGFFLEG